MNGAVILLSGGLDSTTLLHLVRHEHEGVDIFALSFDYGQKHVRELEGVEFDYVITVCGHANENCPVFPGQAKVIHRGFDDPPKLAAAAETDKEKMAAYCRVRDEIRAYIERLPAILAVENGED